MKHFLIPCVVTLSGVGVGHSQGPVTVPPEPARLPILGNSPGVTVGNSPGVTVGNRPNARPDDRLPTPRPNMSLIRDEKPIALGAVEVIHQGDAWQVMAGKTLFTNTGQDWKAAEKVGGILRALQFSMLDQEAVTNRDLQQTAWHTIGESRPVVGYVTVKGQPARTARGITHQSISIDPNTIRTEQVRGVWVVKDFQNIVLNFGPEKQEAEQAVAAVMKYGFNRVGYVGAMEAPSLRYFFAEPDINPVGSNTAPSALQTLTQEMALDRTGVEVPGFGSVGQKVNIDARKLTIRKDGADLTLVSGTETIARFGRDEWSARDAMRILQQLNPTAMVTIGSPGIAFFLNGAEVTNRLPFGTVGAPFSAERLTIRQTADGLYHLHEQLGRDLATAKSREEIEAIKAAITHYKLNRTCQIGMNPKTSMNFLGRVQ